LLLVTEGEWQPAHDSFPAEQAWDAEDRGITDAVAMGNPSGHRVDPSLVSQHGLGDAASGYRDASIRVALAGIYSQASAAREFGRFGLYRG
jgi:hypothetical protein